MTPFREISLHIVAWAVCFCSMTGLSAVAGQPDSVTPIVSGQADAKGDSAKGESPKIPKVSKLQQRVAMDDVEWQAISPAINKVLLLSKQLRNVRDTKGGLPAFKVPKNNLPVDPSRPAPPAAPLWLLDLSDKAAALRAASEDPTLRPVEVEARLAQFRAARAHAEQLLTADLTEARQELRELVTARQELTLTLSGLLD
jgi:hypothetical protein